jgi:hypothetical protein
MPSARDYVVYSYDNERDGQVAVGTVLSGWRDAQGHSKLLLQGAFAGGTTTVVVEQSRDGVATDLASADLLSNLGTGAEVNIAYPYFNILITQSVAPTTNAELSVKVAD